MNIKQYIAIGREIEFNNIQSEPQKTSKTSSKNNTSNLPSDIIIDPKESTKAHRIIALETIESITREIVTLLDSVAKEWNMQRYLIEAEVTTKTNKPILTGDNLKIKPLKTFPIPK